MDDDRRTRGRRLALAMAGVTLAGGWVWVRPALAVVLGG